MGAGTFGAKDAVSIITCTKRPECMKMLFDNYGRQRYKRKELIVILNTPNANFDSYLYAAQAYANVKIYSMPHDTLGRCLNYGVQAATSDYLAKFDDDDYYAPDYLTDSMRALQKTKADIVGKRAHYMYLEGKSLLLLRYAVQENQYVPLVQGATLLVRRHVFGQVAFPNQTRGECVKFCADCRAKGFKIYSAGKGSFVAIRRQRDHSHTWSVSDQRLLANRVKVWKVRDFKTFIGRTKSL